MNSFQIANFKAFSDLQTIPLKPITIIFGPNSSGKSSVIHSLLLARHGVDTQSLDATYPSIAGELSHRVPFRRG
jgi:AAA15 family ATPase/GTPase